MATCSIRLSCGAQRTVTAGPQKDMKRSIGLIRELSAPLRPWASWIVAEENAASRLTTSASGRSMLVLTWIMGLSLQGVGIGGVGNAVRLPSWLAEGADGLVDGRHGFPDDLEARGKGN